MWDEILEILRKRKQTLTFAESCTGGLLSSMLTENPGISDVFLGSIVAYSNSLKERSLGVSPQLFNTVGAVSRPVALAMAHGAKNLTGASWAVSITGIAGPTGGTTKKPVGLVCFGMVGPGFEEVSQHMFSGHRKEIQASSAQFAVQWLKENL